MASRKSLTLSAVPFVAALIAAPTQAETSGGSEPTYGTANTSIYQLNAWDFEPLRSNITTDFMNPALRYVTASPTGTPVLVSGVRLPSGAILDYIYLLACDDGADDLTASLFACEDAGGACTLVGSVETFVSLGCGITSSGVAPHTVDNTQTYYLQVVLGIGTETRLRGVRIVYHLQVSPDPAIQSFTDVPIGHPFHQFVEALYDAGITAGYPDGRFGVDDSITRGQMAVFLSIALGLHWPN